jgi:hypothetical protein
MLGMHFQRNGFGPFGQGTGSVATCAHAISSALQCLQMRQLGSIRALHNAYRLWRRWRSVTMPPIIQLTVHCLVPHCQHQCRGCRRFAAWCCTMLPGSTPPAAYHACPRHCVSKDLDMSPSMPYCSGRSVCHIAPCLEEVSMSEAETAPAELSSITRGITMSCIGTDPCAWRA